MQKATIIFLISFLGGFGFFALRNARLPFRSANGVSAQSSPVLSPSPDRSETLTWSALYAKSPAGYLRMCATLAADLSGLTGEQLERMLSEPIDRRDQKARVLQQLVFDQLCAVDLERALRSENVELRAAGFKSLASRDPERALKELERLSGDRSFLQCSQQVASSLPGEYFENFYVLLKRLEQKEGNGRRNPAQRMLREIWYSWGEKDSLSMLKNFAAVEESQLRLQVISMNAGELGEQLMDILTDPVERRTAAENHLRTLVWQKKDTGPFMSTLDQNLREELPLFLTMLEQQQSNRSLIPNGEAPGFKKLRPPPLDPDASQQDLQEYAQQLMQFDPQEAIDWMRSDSTGMLDNQITRDIIHHWKVKEPVAAATFLASRQELISDVFVAGDLAKGYGRVNPAAAADWAAGLKDREYRAQAIGEALGTWAATAPDAAIAFATGLEEPEFRQQAYDSIFAAMIVQNPQGGLDLLDQFPPSDKPAAVKAAVQNLAEYFPNIAARELNQRADQFEDQKAAGEIATTIAKSWVVSDSVEALKWATHLDHPILREKATAAVIEEWAGSDALGASANIRNLEDKTVREQASAALAEKAVFVDPESALEWASSIEDPELRGRTLHRIGSEWKDSNLTRAREAILSMEMPDSRRAKIEEMLDD